MNAVMNIVDLSNQKINLENWMGYATWWEGSLDMGSGITTGYLQPVKAISKDRIERTAPVFRLSFPSVVDTAEKSLARIANLRQAPKSMPASILAPGEFVLRNDNTSFEHLVGNLATEEGLHPTDAKGDSNRYWGEHIRVIAQAVFGAIIPDTHAEIRMNFCMPYSLYTAENKERAMNNLDGIYTCYVNEVYHQLDIRVGTVVPEGYAAITRYGDPSGENVTLDIGDRTTEIIRAKGFKISSRDSTGELYGVRQVIEQVQDELRTEHGRDIDVEACRNLLKAYTAKAPLPKLKVARGGENGYLSSEKQYEIIARKTLPLAKALGTFVRATLNKEGAEVGSSLDTATIYGGGAYLFYPPLKHGIPDDLEMEHGVLRDLYLPAEPEYLNASYMHELVAQHTKLRPEMWTRKR